LPCLAFLIAIIILDGQSNIIVGNSFPGPTTRQFSTCQTHRVKKCTPRLLITTKNQNRITNFQKQRAGLPLSISLLSAQVLARSDLKNQ